MVNNLAKQLVKGLVPNLDQIRSWGKERLLVIEAPFERLFKTVNRFTKALPIDA